MCLIPVIMTSQRCPAGNHVGKSGDLEIETIMEIKGAPGKISLLLTKIQAKLKE